jgi:4-hydroxy-tetrahydrodipicolinate synthase
VAPRLCVRAYDTFRSGDHEEAQAIWIALGRLTAALFAESNPVPVKYALKLLGHMPASVRLPLCEASEATRREVAEALTCLGLATRTGEGEPSPRLVLGEAA